MQIPSITLAICTYNNCQLLNRTLSTITQQQVDLSINWSVLVVNNNSTDKTVQVVESHIQNNSIHNLRMVFETQQGLSYARRRAVTETTSDLIAFVDDDCFLSSNWVQEAVSFFQVHPQAGAVGGKVQLQWEIAPNESFLRLGGYLAEQNHGDVAIQMPSSTPTYLVGAGLVVCREALINSGWLENSAFTGRRGENLSAGDDSEIVLKIRNAGYQLWYNPAMYLDHFIPKSRISEDYFCRLLRGIGRSKTILYILGYRLQPTFLVRLKILLNSIKYLCRLILSITYRNILHRNNLSLERKAYLFDSVGSLEGSIEFLFKKYSL